MFTARALFPIAGLAASTIRLPPWKPPVGLLDEVPGLAPDGERLLLDLAGRVEQPA
jgi:hypothetical protein